MTHLRNWRVRQGLGSACVWDYLGWEAFEACLRCCGPIMEKNCASSSFVLPHTNTLIPWDVLQTPTLYNSDSNFSPIQTQTPLPSSVCEGFFFLPRSCCDGKGWTEYKKDRGSMQIETIIIACQEVHGIVVGVVFCVSFAFYFPVFNFYFVSFLLQMNIIRSNYSSRS